MGKEKPVKFGGYTKRISPEDTAVETTPGIALAVEEAPPIVSGITLNEYLANYSRKRNLDSAITLWYQKKDPKNTLREKEDWDKIIERFYSE